MKVSKGLGEVWIGMDWIGLDLSEVWIRLD